MKTKIIRKAFAEANAAVKGCIGKDALSIFAKVRLDATGGNVSLTGTDGVMQLEWRLKGETEEDGAVTVPGARLAAFAAAMPDGVVAIETTATKMKLEGGEGVSFRLASDVKEVYPAMVGPAAEAPVAPLPACTLREMLRKVKFAVSTDATRANLGGVNISLADGKLAMVAADGRRLAHVEFEVGTRPEDTFNMTMPGKAVGVLYGLLEKVDGGEDVDLAADANAARVLCAGWSFTTKAVADAFPNWRQVVLKVPGHLATIGRREFLDALGRAALASAEDSGVKIEIAPGRVSFKAKSEFASAEAVTDKCKLAEDVKVVLSFNPRLLKDALDAIDDDEFTLCFSDERSPIVLKCTAPWLAVVMPLRIS